MTNPIEPPGRPGGPGSGHGHDHKKTKKDIKRLTSSPCNRPPAPPTPTISFHEIPGPHHRDFDAKIAWDKVTTDSSGIEIAGSFVDEYEIAYRATDVSGTPLDIRDTKTAYHFKRRAPVQHANVVDATCSGSTHTLTTGKDHGFSVGDRVTVSHVAPSGYNGNATITAVPSSTKFSHSGASGLGNLTKKGLVEDNEDSYHIITDRLPHPKEWYWQTRGRARSGQHCWSDWSEWSSPVAPIGGQPPTPINVVIYDNDRDSVTLDWDPNTVDILHRGTVSVSSGSGAVSGVGTHFLSDVGISTQIVINGQLKRVLSISSDTAMVMDSNFSATVSGVPIAERVPDPDVRRSFAQISKHANFDNIYKEDEVGATKKRFKIADGDLGATFYGRVRNHDQEWQKSKFVAATTSGNSIAWGAGGDPGPDGVTLDPHDIPIGTIHHHGAGTPPGGWLECDGSSLLRAGTYAALFAVIGTSWGSVDGTHFTIPDLRNRQLYGRGSLYPLADDEGDAEGSRDQTHGHHGSAAHDHGSHDHGLHGVETGFSDSDVDIADTGSGTLVAKGDGGPGAHGHKHPFESGTNTKLARSSGAGADETVMPGYDPTGAATGEDINENNDPVKGHRHHPHAAALAIIKFR
jgi:microcystin-dependent protein